MNQFAKDILYVLKQLDKPVSDITDIEGQYDIRSDNFVAAFQFLESSGYISSVSNGSCGLEISGDGLPTWSADPFVITEQGCRFLNPPKPEKESWVKWWLKPVAVALSVVFIGWLATELYKDYTLNNSSNSDAEKRAGS